MDAADTDREILGLIEAGDDAGFDLMVEKYAAMLYRYARRMCADESDAEDALQDTFLAAKQKIHQFRGDGKLRNWLFSITGNACRQKLRKLKTRQGVELKLEDVTPGQEDPPDLEPAPWLASPADQALSAELAEKLEQAIAQVPPTNRSVLILRDLEGLTTREAAKALDISEEAAKVRLHRARAFVRNLLRDYFEGKE